MVLDDEELMLQLGGLEGTLEIHGILFGQINLIKSDMKKWRITLEVNANEGEEKIGPIKVNKRICKASPFVEDCLLLQWIQSHRTWEAQGGTIYLTLPTERSRIRCL